MITWPCIYDKAASAGMALTAIRPEMDEHGIIWHVRPMVPGEPFCGLATGDSAEGEQGSFIVATEKPVTIRDAKA